jgi:hypothetical protein
VSSLVDLTACIGVRGHTRCKKSVRVGSVEFLVLLFCCLSLQDAKLRAVDDSILLFET